MRVNEVLSRLDDLELVKLSTRELRCQGTKIQLMNDDRFHNNRRGIYLKGSKYDIIAQLNEDYRKLDIYQLSLRNMINVKNNDNIEYYIYIIAKEN